MHENTSAELPELLTVKEVAALFRVSNLTIKRWEKRGVINPVRINRRGDRRYVRTDIEALIAARRPRYLQNTES